MGRFIERLQIVGGIVYACLTDQVTPFEWTLHHSLGAVSHLVMMEGELEGRSD